MRFGDRSLVLCLLALTFLLVAPALAQELSEPPKADLPYLIHATQLIETEQSEATEQSVKKQVLYAVPGVASKVRTPLAGPEFLFRSENIDPYDIALYRMDPKNGRREILLRNKKKILARPIRLSVFPVQRGVVKLRVYESLDIGEYCLTPNGSNKVFCFSVY